jgi:hypothetical protein
MALNGFLASVRVPAAVAALSFAIYLVTLHPTVSGGDSGELIAVAHSMGVAHPPGYPLYTLLAKLFSLMPLKTIAWRVNLLSAVCGAAAAGVLSWTVGRWSGDPFASFVAGGLFAFAPGVWRYATQAEVFALNNLLLCLLVAISLEFSRTRAWKWAVRAAVVIGLGLANQHAFALTALPLVAWALWAGRRTLLCGKKPLYLALFTTLGLAFYVYLPLASVHVAAVTWGDCRDLAGFGEHLFRNHVGTFRLGSAENGPGSGLWVQLGLYGADLGLQLLWIGIPITILGIRQSLRGASREFALSLLTAYAAYLLIFHCLANFDLRIPLLRGVQARFWQQPLCTVMLWFGLGYAHLTRHARRAARLFGLVIVALQISINWTSMDQHTNRFIEHYGKDLLDRLPPHSLLIGEGDLTIFTCYYLQACEHYREDVQVIDLATLSYQWRKRWILARRPGVVMPGARYAPHSGDGFDVRTFLEANARRFPIYCMSNVFVAEPQAEQLYEAGSSHVLAPVRRRTGRPEFARWLKESDALLPRHPLPPVDRYDATTWERVLYQRFFVPRHDRAVRIIQEAHRQRRIVLLEQGLRSFEHVVREFPDCPAAYFKELVAAYASLQPPTPALARRIEELQRAYIERNPVWDPDLPDIRSRLPRLLR